MSRYLRPTSLDEALAARASGGFTVLAGGTDVLPTRVGRGPDLDVLDLTAIDALRGIARDGEGWRIGALATWSDLMAADLPPDFAALKQAAAEVGGRQIQNAGTLVGNLCNASPAADGAPVLLAMDASIELSSPTVRRALPLADFLQGNRRTSLRSDELATAILVPSPRHPTVSRFLKLGARRYLVISIVMVAIVLEIDAGRIARAGIAVGACGATAKRLPALETRLIGHSLGPALADLVEPDDLAPLTPIDDIRATAAYRLDACLTLLRRGLAETA